MATLWMILLTKIVTFTFKFLLFSLCWKSSPTQRDDAGVCKANNSKTTTTDKYREEIDEPLIRRTKRETLGCLTGLTKGNRQRADARIGSYIKIQREWELIKARWHLDKRGIEDLKDTNWIF